MYENGAMLAVFLLIYSAIAGRVGHSLISGPIVFTTGRSLDFVKILLAFDPNQPRAKAPWYS